MGNEITTTEKEKNALTVFSGAKEAFELAQRQAKALSESDLVPQLYKGRVANCLVALEISHRCQASTLMVMQNLHVIHGKPSWSSTYIIAAVNSCGKFEPLRFKFNADKSECIAWTKDKATGEVLEGPPASIAMAKAEGWYDKNGSKWKTMPQLMLQYRCAAFFGRLYVPEILNGMRTADEEQDMIDVTPREETAQTTAIESLNAKIKAKKKVGPATPPPPELEPDPSVYAVTASEANRAPLVEDTVEVEHL